MGIDVVSFEEIFFDLFFLDKCIILDFISERFGTFQSHGETADDWRGKSGNHSYSELS